MHMGVLVVPRNGIPLNATENCWFGGKPTELLHIPRFWYTYSMSLYRYGSRFTMAPRLYPDLCVFSAVPNAIDVVARWVVQQRRWTKVVRAGSNEIIGCLVNLVWVVFCVSFRYLKVLIPGCPCCCPCCCCCCCWWWWWWWWFILSWVQIWHLGTASSC